ncbi:DUF3127 domain-containing protein [Mesohalobacter halotolerans]|jgi:ABC-type lipoprotein export system ATPase subunit|uniref:DUF3127 domain-containing protein n=1 Tax=Mesohalobacter halotolerans TaxID=1883405 RepID=A0A4U5TTJ3_9FLAO|nr:DUF3127 domain-containing protein [Mesohalobacter halotolerans]MBS3738814.1 DUF3127 domain-containing protein [Psychroflexus sp.]NBC57772.1 DUF3127 domain-containing protein [Bacteroidota bacterium]TKS57536.1 DUF3127 domain-containing protein [Mesohalobacter halotolerans]
MEVEGKIKVIGETKEYGKNGFRKREVVITTEEQYPQFLNIEFVQDKTQLVDNFSVGENVKIGINLRGREWVSPQGETKYFNSIQGWRIERLDQSQNQDASIPPADQFEPVDDLNEEDPEDDLPF